MPPLHDYQDLGVQYLRKNDRAALLLDMGLGKTATVLSALEPRHLPALVTAPKRVASLVWPEEVKKWRPDLRVGLAVGSPEKRARVLRDPQYDIVVINRDSLRDAVAPASRFNTLVLDEMSGFKNRSAMRWAAARKITKVVPHVWGMTGTPAPNGLMDLWAQIFLLDGGERLGRNITGFRRRYFYPSRTLPNGIVTEWELHDGADKKIHSLLEDITLSMRAEGRIDVKKPIFNRVSVTIPTKVRQIYKDLKRDLVADLEILGGEIHSAANAAVLTGKLSQITAGFMYQDDQINRPGEYDLVHREKVRAVQEIVEGSAGEPVVVFYWYKQELDMLREAFGTDLHTLDEPDIMMAWNSGKVPVLAANPASAGHGLNLQHGGHICVWTTLPMMNLELWDQANARLARQGQTHQVIAHVLEVDRTVDVVQWKRLVEKATVQDALRDHLESPL